MQRFGNQVEKILESVGVFYVGLWVVFLGVDEVWEFCCVVDEEYWGVVIYYILIVFFCVEFE